MVGEKSVSCGVWLYDNCFLDSVSDDTVLLQKYISGGINNISGFDVEDVFSGRNVNFTASEKHFAQKLDGGYFDTVIDVKRCRLARIYSLPLKVKGIKGYELLGDDETNIEAAPQNLAGIKKLSVDGKATKNKQWERRLLDLSLKNSLLNFKPDKNCLHVVSSDINATFGSLSSHSEYAVLEKPTDGRGMIDDLSFFGSASRLSALSALLEVELKNKRIRTYSSKDEVNDVMRYLIKKAKTAEEEAGRERHLSRIRFSEMVRKRRGRAEIRALILCPAKIEKKQGRQGLFRALYRRRNAGQYDAFGIFAARI